MHLLATVALAATALASYRAVADAQTAAATPAERGAATFHTAGCEHCHGPAGVGGAEGPDLQLVRKRKTEAEITRQIHEGGTEMPAFGDDLTADQIQELVAFLRKPRKFVKAPPGATKADPKTP